MKNISIWKDTENIKEYPKLNKDINCDVLIIGGGITGISTLYKLNNTNLNIVLVEQNKLGFSVTGNSTGKLNYLQNDHIDKIRKNFNDKIASKYIKSQIDAIKEIKNIIEKENIDCSLEKVKSYLYTNKIKEIEKLKNLEKFLNKNNIKTYKENLNIVKNKYTFYVEDTYIFNPVEYIYLLAQKIKHPIYEKTSIKKIKKINNNYECYTNKNKITAKKVVLATHYPYFLLPLLFPIKCTIEKSYLSASKYKEKPFSLISYTYPFISIRTYNNYLIYLSNSHKINKTLDIEKQFNELKKKLNDLKLKPDYLWSNTDIIINDGLPYIGQIKNNLFLATGYNTWGLTNGVLAGKIISDLIQNKENQYSKLFNPKRINITKVIGIFNDIYVNINSYIKAIKNKSNPKCPHLGCTLIYNKIEKTWDCPCHGSKFDKDGKCITSPANKHLQ